MSTGITILIIMNVVILTQLLMQAHTQNRRHKEILRRLDKLSAKKGK